MAVFEPIKAKRNAKILLAAQYRPRTLKEFLQNSLFYHSSKTDLSNQTTITDGAHKFLTEILEQEGIDRSKWKQVLDKTGLSKNEFYNNVLQKLLGAGLVRYSKNRYIVSTEFSMQLEIINTLWRSFIAEWD